MNQCTPPYSSFLPLTRYQYLEFWARSPLSVMIGTLTLCANNTNTRMLKCASTQLLTNQAWTFNQVKLETDLDVEFTTQDELGSVTWTVPGGFPSEFDVTAARLVSPNLSRTCTPLHFHSGCELHGAAGGMRRE